MPVYAYFPENNVGGGGYKELKEGYEIVEYVIHHLVVAFGVFTVPL